MIGMVIPAFAQNQNFTINPPKKSRFISGMYIQWGWNNVWFTRSNIHFKLSNGDNFTLHNAKAHQRPGFYDIYKNPTQVSLPQYNYRVGFYLNEQHTRAIEINFDHTKYVVTDGQTVHVTGTIAGKPVDQDMVVDPQTFLHFEHTDGANWLHINYVRQYPWVYSKKLKRNIFTYLWKAGAGINIPRTDFTYHGDRLNNKFHVAGFNFGVEGGARVYPFKIFFLEFTGKTGFVDYLDALANTKAMKGNRASQTFEYVEVIGTFGFDIKF